MVADASAPQNVVVLTGAGLSCASGIPDFRSPGGLYATLQPDFITATEHQRQLMKDNPTAVVDIRLFAQNPFPYLEVRRPFILGTMERKWQPTLGHFFIKVLADRNKLRRLYTQNIDGLDAHAGVPDELLVNVHGSLGSVACEFCKRSVPYAEFADEVKHKIRNIYDAADASSPTDSSFIVCKNCGKPQVKPATVLYGTQLPPKFFECVEKDFRRDAADDTIFIIAGTSLTVAPACNLPDRCPVGNRLLINLEAVGDDVGLDFARGDAFLQGTCDQGFLALAGALGWLDDLRKYRDSMCAASAAVLDGAAASKL